MARCGPKGITLLEVLLVVLILGLLAAGAVPHFVYSAQDRATECGANVTLINAVLDQHFAKTGCRMLADGTDLARVVGLDKERFPRGMPKCPFGKPYEYDPATGHIIPHKH